MKIYFPIHLDGGNRGCEAIAKGTAVILKQKKENLIGLCSDIGLDSSLGIDDYVTLQPSRNNSLASRAIRKAFNLFVRDEWKRKEFSYRQEYASFLNQITPNDVMLSTGGDMMCYGENQVIYTVDCLHKRGIHSVLWGCSIGEQNLTPRKLDALGKFAVIYARETLTKEVLENHGFNNVVVYPDPAFVLEPTECPLPECFKIGEVIGLNLSNFVMGGFADNTKFAKEVDALMRHVLDSTDLHILLIPHVLWKDQDDRIISQQIKAKYNSDRISILDSEHLNYCQIRHVISRCKYFIGARTHAVISAYSTCTPAIAIGYSIKSRGIAKDLGMPEETLVDSVNIIEGQLMEAFNYIFDNAKNIRQHLLIRMDSYVAKAWKASEIIQIAK